jgi:hypothetical protein
MKIYPGTLGKTTRSLVVLKFAADNSKYQQDKIITIATIYNITNK